MLVMEISDSADAACPLLPHASSHTQAAAVLNKHSCWQSVGASLQLDRHRGLVYLAIAAPSHAALAVPLIQLGLQYLPVSPSFSPAGDEENRPAGEVRLLNATHHPPGGMGGD